MFWNVQDIAFYVGYSVPTALVFIAITLVFWRRDKYFESEVDDTAMSRFLSISWYGIRNQSRKQDIIDAAVDEYEYNFFDVAMELNGGPYGDHLVEEVKGVYSVFGFLPFMLVFWTAYRYTLK